MAFLDPTNRVSHIHLYTSPQRIIVIMYFVALQYNAQVVRSK